MHLIRPVEDDPAGSDGQSSDSFIKSGFCQVHTPCPLAENRNRFVHLVADISSRKDDYAAQLSSLILAGTSSSSVTDDDSERAIRRSLFTPDAEQAKVVQEDKDSKLWQARLVLAIAETLDREEEEIARNLAMLEDDQAELFKELHGDIDELEEENPFAELSRLESNLGAANSGNMQKRYNAWKTLFLEGEMRECEIFLTTSQDAGDLLLEAYEKKTNQPAPLAATLTLPGLIGWNSAEAYQAVLEFREQNRGLLARIQAYLVDILQKDSYTKQATDTAVTALTEQWHGQLETRFPADQFGRTPVKCYVFPGQSCATLIGTEQPENTAAKNGLLIVVD